MSVQIQNLEKVSRKLRNLANFQQWATPPMEKAVQIVYEETQEQPEKAPGAFSAEASPEQKKAYWAKVRSGEARHSEASGYIRSNKLKRGWKKKVKKSVSGVTGTVDNGVSYGQYVQGMRRQRFHTISGWQRDIEIANKVSGDVMDVFTDAARRELNK